MLARNRGLFSNGDAHLRLVQRRARLNQTILFDNNFNFFLHLHDLTLVNSSFLLFSGSNLQS